VQLKHGGALFLKEENRKKFPAIVVFPQCPAEDFWANLKVEDKTPREWTYDYAGAPKPALAAAMELVKQLIRDEGVDARRVYISGLSMGGMGTFEAVFRYPNLFAAALPICGGGNDQAYDKRLSAIPFWVFHGDADPVVPVKSSRVMVGKLTAIGAQVRSTEYPGVGHDSWTNVFAEPEYLSWMFKQKRK
jgi:predicted peptidase